MLVNVVVYCTLGVVRQILPMVVSLALETGRRPSGGRGVKKRKGREKVRTEGKEEPKENESCGKERLIYRKVEIGEEEGARQRKVGKDGDA